MGHRIYIIIPFRLYFDGHILKNLDYPTANPIIIIGVRNRNKTHNYIHAGKSYKVYEIYVF